MIINLHTNVDETRDFKRLLKEKTIEGALRFLKIALQNNKVKVDVELIPETDKYSKDARLLIKNIRFL